MSRSGTLQDALRVVDEFQRAVVPSSQGKELSPSAAKHEDADDVVKRGRGAGKKGGREKSEKEERRKSKRDKDRHRKRRERHAVRRDDGDDDDDDDDEDSDQSDDDDDDLHRRHSKEKKRRERKKKKKDRRERRKEERKTSSRRAEGKGEKESSRRREERKQRERARRLRSPEGDSSRSEDKDSGSGSESSESEGGNSALRAEQVAAGIVEEFPEVQNDLHQLLQTVDSGQAVDISGLPNKRLVVLLQQLFQSLSLKKSTGGAYLLPAGSQRILDRLSWSSVSKSFPTAETRERGSEFPTSTSNEKEDSDDIQKSHSKMDAAAGPFPRPQENVDPQKRRVMGPAMPSAEMLQAAAKLTAAEEALRDAEAALENDPLIGPPPPAAVAEAASANDAERYEEVTRITASDVGDAYELLGLKQGVSAGDLKKRYWKLSLLVHPDKCQHPLAQQAFMALNKAFKDLQDPLKRADIDQKANDKLAKEEYEADKRAQLQAAQWRKLRGEEALPGDAELLQGDAKDEGRDEWMTKLPPERQAGGPPSQQNTFFSRTEKKGRGDTSAWTDTPLEKAERAKMQYLEAYKQAAITGPESTELLFEKEKTAKTAAFLDEYNEKKRSLSLLETHQQKSKKGTKKARKEKTKLQGDEKKEWAEAHPWKPWDREKDLAAGRQKVNWDDKKTVEDSLGSRFGAGGQRTFL